MLKGIGRRGGGGHSGIIVRGKNAINCKGGFEAFWVSKVLGSHLDMGRWHYLVRIGRRLRHGLPLKE